MCISSKTFKELDELWDKIGLAGPSGSIDRRKLKKHDEVLGFSEHIVKAAEELSREGRVVFLDCGCGKSYLSFVLNDILTNTRRIDAYFIGVDTSDYAIRKCEETRAALEYGNMEFHRCRAIDFEPKMPVDIVVIALHAYNTATDEAIAKGIKLRARYIMAVPCCQNQIRGQLRGHHPLEYLTQFGVLKYSFANLLTEALRSLILKGAGYEVKLDEIVPPTCTPKNILIQARKIKEPKGRGMAEYLELSRQFNVRIKLEDLLPEIFEKIVMRDA